VEDSVAILVSHLHDDLDLSKEHWLTTAAYEGNVGMLKGWIAAGSNINYIDVDGNSALTLASMMGHEACVRELLSAGCDTDIPKTALDEVENDRILRILKGENVPIMASDIEMENKVVDVDSVTQAASSGSLTDFLDINSVSIDVLSKGLMTKPVSTSMENVLQVLWCGADIESRDENGNTPIMFAAINGSLEVVRELIDCGADIDTRNDEDQTPIMLAALSDWDLDSKSRSLELVTAFIDCGAKINVRDMFGDTPLHYAKMNIPVVSKLITAGADIYAKGRDGRTALYLHIKAEEKRQQILDQQQKSMK